MRVVPVSLLGSVTYLSDCVLQCPVCGRIERKPPPVSPAVTHQSGERMAWLNCMPVSVEGDK
jgi:hypothetical protein